MRKLKILALLAVLLLVAPTPAHAWWGWLDDLSGPGPWMFVDAKFRIVCVPDTPPSDVQSTSKSPGTRHLRSLSSFDKPVRVLAAIGGVGCVLPGQWSTMPKASLNFATSTFVAVANNPRPPGAGRVAMQKYEFSASAFLDAAKIFEANAGGGVLKGLGDSDFSRGYWTVSATIAPYAAVAPDSVTTALLRTITVNIGVVVVPKGFTSQDFGVTGSFRSEHEVLKTVSLTLDWSRYQRQR